MTDDLRRSGSTPEDSTSGADVIARAKEAHARRWEVPGPSYRDPVPTGVVELGDWASEYLPELLAEVERLRGALNEVRALADDAVWKRLARPAVTVDG